MNEISISLENLEKSIDGFLLEFNRLDRDLIQGIVIKKKDNYIIISSVVDPSIMESEPITVSTGNRMKNSSKKENKVECIEAKNIYGKLLHQYGIHINDEHFMTIFPGLVTKIEEDNYAIHLLRGKKSLIWIDKYNILK